MIWHCWSAHCSSPWLAATYPHTFPFNVVAANSFASSVACGDCKIANVLFHASSDFWYRSRYSWAWPLDDRLALEDMVARADSTGANACCPPPFMVAATAMVLVG